MSSSENPPRKNRAPGKSVCLFGGYFMHGFLNGNLTASRWKWSRLDLFMKSLWLIIPLDIFNMYTVTSYGKSVLSVMVYLSAKVMILLIFSYLTGLFLGIYGGGEKSYRRRKIIDLTLSVLFIWLISSFLIFCSFHIYKFAPFSKGDIDFFETTAGSVSDIVADILPTSWRISGDIQTSGLGFAIWSSFYASASFVIIQFLTWQGNADGGTEQTARAGRLEQIGYWLCAHLFFVLLQVCSLEFYLPRSSN